MSGYKVKRVKTGLSTWKTTSISSSGKIRVTNSKRNASGAVETFGGVGGSRRTSTYTDSCGFHHKTVKTSPKSTGHKKSHSSSGVAKVYRSSSTGTTSTSRRSSSKSSRKSGSVRQQKGDIKGILILMAILFVIYLWQQYVSPAINYVSNLF